MFFHELNGAGINLNATLYDTNRSHQPIMKQLFCLKMPEIIRQEKYFDNNDNASLKKNILSYYMNNVIALLMGFG